MKKKELATTMNYIAALKNYRKQLADMLENIQVIGERSATLGGAIHQKNTALITKKINQEVKTLDDSIYLLEEELKELHTDT